MNEISIPLQTLAALASLEGRPLDQGANAESLSADVRSRYDFLAQPVTVRIDGEALFITCADETQEDKAEAARFFARAARRAQEGEHERVAALCRRALCFQPSLHAARRELARAYIAIGEAENARVTLWQALRVDPRDTWSLVTLAGLLLQDRCVEQAQRIARVALEIEASNPEALDILGQALLAAGCEAEALGTFGQALLLNPQLPGSRLGAARALLAHGRAEESMKMLQAMFTHSGQTPRTAPVFAQARDLCAEVQEALIRRTLEQARQAVENFRVGLEERDGVPIRVRYGEQGSAWAQVAWFYNVDHHLVGCSGSLPEPIRLHLLAHEFMHLQMESEARHVGKLHAFTAGTNKGHPFLDLFASQARELRRDGYDPQSVDLEIARVAVLFANMICNIPLDMLVESRLREQLPVLAPAQFLSMRHFLGQPDAFDDNPGLRLILPRPLLRAAMALSGALRIFADHIHRGATEFSAHCRNQPTFGLSQELSYHWQLRFPHLGPADHYRFVEEFVAMLGLEGVFGWRLIPAPVEGDQARRAA